MRNSKSIVTGNCSKNKSRKRRRKEKKKYGKRKELIHVELTNALIISNIITCYCLESQCKYASNTIS